MHFRFFVFFSSLVVVGQVWAVEPTHLAGSRPNWTRAQFVFCGTRATNCVDKIKIGRKKYRLRGVFPEIDEYLAQMIGRQRSINGKAGESFEFLVAGFLEKGNKTFVIEGLKGTTVDDPDFYIPQQFCSYGIRRIGR